MLAILLIQMEWTKKERNPESAIQRQKYFQPVKMEDDVKLSGEGVFYKECSYYQNQTQIKSSLEISEQLEQELYKKEKGKAFTQNDEYEHRIAFKRQNCIKRHKGAFYNIDKLELPYIKLEFEPNHNTYHIKWFDARIGKPYRRGGNEDFNKKGTKLAGIPNLLNETAFILKEEEAGILKYNYRTVYFSDPWYKCYYVYVVHTKELTPDTFIRNYQYEYNQLADLF